MTNFYLSDEVATAAKYFSAQEGSDVEVTCADGSRTLYLKGEEVSPPWLASPMPLVEPGKAVAELDITPTQVRLGHWHNEAEQFIASLSLTVPNFIDLYKSALSAAKK